LEERRFAAVDAVIQKAVEAAERESDPLATLALLLRLILRSEADPYLLNGILIDALVASIAEKIPAEKRAETAAAAHLLLANRLRQRGI